MSAEDADLRTVKRLIEELESQDAFERRNAIENLALLTQQRLDFAWRGTEAERASSVARWKKWLAKEERRRRGGGLKAAVELLQSVELPLGSGANLQEALEKAFKDLPPEKKKALIAQMLAKVAADAAANAAGVSGHETCERCQKRPATVRVTSRTKTGEYEQTSLCEICATKDAG
jgi:DNA-directed RNA polymerase specialized sigma24 family protein